MLYAGTSGFAYPAWRPAFYPPKLPASRFLEYYATQLNAVEANYTYRRLPSRATLEKWVAATPPGFLFAPKAHMRITHILRLQDAAEFTNTFLNALQPLREAQRLGPVLFQLPPKFSFDAVLFAEFLSALPRQAQYAFEFRDTSWFQPQTYKLLANNSAALCLAESDALDTPEVLTAPFVYLRLRHSSYTPAEFRSIVDRVRAYNPAERDIFAIFKHEDEPQGALHAVELRAALS